MKTIIYFQSLIFIVLIAYESIPPVTKKVKTLLENLNPKKRMISLSNSYPYKIALH